MANKLNDDWPGRVAVLGVGLLGGSVALSIRRNRPGTTFVGLARSEAKMKRLTALQVMDRVVRSVPEACRGCDVVVVASPVDCIADLVVEASLASPEDCLITDVGSTKAGIVATLADHPVAAKKFVAAHPIAGSEKSGPEAAKSDLFDGKVIVVTPGPMTTSELVEKAEIFWQLTGGRTLKMDPVEHDTHLAAISHVPHLVSALVAGMVDPQSRSLVGSGWTDMTRVAAGDPTMWTAICRENRRAIKQQLDRFATDLEQLRRIVESGDDAALKAWLTEAQKVKQQTP